MNALYDRARERFLTGQLSWMTTDWRPYLLDSGYVFDKEHVDLATDVPTEFRAKRAPQVLLAKSYTDGIAACGPIGFGPVNARPDGRLVTGLLIADEASGLLLWYGDVGFGLPFVADGSEVVASPDIQLDGFFQV
jgi:hypothetical protein